jgi:transcriptional regulator with XRE-family HTH domain
MNSIWIDQAQERANVSRFGEKLRTLRKRRGLTVQQLGDLLGVHNSHVVRLEKGTRKPSVDLVLEISRIFQVAADQLIKDELDLD